MIALTAGSAAAQLKKPWNAPADAKAVKNPVPATPENLQAAAQIFKQQCVLCHGEKGKGDGIAADPASPPANFTDPKLFATDTDGSLFWKIGEGFSPMPSFKKVLTDTQRWQLVDYVRSLNKPGQK